jgi:hypothetical protein
MAKTNEAAFAEALDSAVEEAVSEYGDTDDGNDEFESEELSADEASESEEDIDEVQEDEDELEASADEDEVEEDALSVVEWNGNPDELPSDIVIDGKKYDLTKTYKAMQAGFTKKMQEVAEARKRYEELSQQALQSVEAQRQKAMAAEDPRPTNPTSDMTEEQQERRWDDIQRWVARDEQRRLVKEGIIPDPDRVKAQMAEQERQFAAQRRYNMLTSQPGYSEEVEQAMVQLAQNDEYWAKQLEDDAGTLKFFEFVQEKLTAAQLRAKAAELENAKIKRSASASKRSTPKPSSQKKATSSKPSERFAELAFEDQLESIIGDTFGL